MKRPRLAQLLLLSGVLVVVGLIIVRGVYLYYEGRTQMNAAGTSCNLGDIKVAFGNFRSRHGRWPHSIEEASGEEYWSVGDLSAKLDQLSGLRFRCVTTRDVRYMTKDGEVLKVLVMLPKPYRTQLRPFGEFRTYILASDSSIRTVSPSEITEGAPALPSGDSSEK